eukprot:6189318-Pleurochrysis_carterae.AAC.1
MLCLHLVACLALRSGQKEDLPKTAVAVHAIRLLSEEAAQETMGSWSLEAVQLLVDSDCNQPLEFFNSHSTSLGPQYTVSSSGERCPANPFGAGCFFQGPGGLAGVFNQQPVDDFDRQCWRKFVPRVRRQGMPDVNDSTGNIWIAVEFEIAKTIGCVKVAQQVWKAPCMLCYQTCQPRASSTRRALSVKLELSPASGLDLHAG